MLAIRMQRTGRKGHAMFRLVVQDARRTPTSGKVVASLGDYNPHSKTATLDKHKAAFYLEHGAQPSERAVRLLQSEGVTLPKWANASGAKKGKLRNPDKLRKNQPKEAPKVEEQKVVEAATTEASTQDTSTETEA